ncbi:MAG: hypothetical protein O7G30_02410 [Proteobacteria bacterium]|nr:hypothetical protein [Pseudomonadota bacterium]
MASRPVSLALAASMLGCGAPASAPPERAAVSTVSMIRTETGAEIRVDGERIASVERAGGRRTLSTDAPLAVIVDSAEPLLAGQAYPQRHVSEGRLYGDGSAVRQEYVLMAPPSPIWVEGFGLQVSWDEPGLNEPEHEALRAWLAGEGLVPETTLFESSHESDSGRELVAWYEISGRRIDGSIARRSSTGPAARFDTPFATEGDGWKIHHKRTGENGRFTYHRKSLELVDTIADPESGDELRAYQCGCYGYGIAADWTTLGDDQLYHVHVEWEDYRVSAGLFLGLERRAGFPWIGFGDRQRMQRRARRAKAYRLTDVDEEPFAELVLHFSPDPPERGLGAAAYDLRVPGPDGMVPLARFEAADGDVTVQLYAADALERLDLLLAAMPTQVSRGDGIRDSHLAAVETLLDWVRLLRDPREDTLADVVSDIDALTAVAKVRSLLDGVGARFAAAPEEFPSPPRRLTNRIARAGSP